MMANNFIDHKAQELLRKFRVESGLIGQIAKPHYLLSLPAFVSGWQS